MCADVNECTFDVPMCHKNAVCTNTIGSYACNCVEGFVGSGRWCDDVNECERTGTPLCSIDEKCHNYAGGYVCMCPAIMPSQRPYKELERNILDEVLGDFRDTSIEDWKYPLDYHAHMIRTIYQLVMRTYNYRFKEVSYSFFIEKVAGNDFAVEMYDLRCTDVANVSFPNFCHDDYTNTEFRYFTDVVQMWLIRDAIEPFESWATPPPLVAPNPLESTTTLMPLLTDGPQTTKIVNINGTNFTMTEAPRTTSPPFRACGGNFSGNKGGFFQTPNYPNNYPPKSKCVWHIEAPVSHNVYVRFHSFHLENDRKCFYDYVEIHDEHEDGEVLARYCGQEFTTAIRSGKRKLVVVFYSDDYYQFSGFRAEWQTLSPRVSLTCITYNQMSTMPSSFRETWRDGIEKESDKSSYVPVSRLLACKQYPRCNHTRPGDVIFTLEHFRDDRNVKICIHWMLDQIGTTWTTRPCRVIKTNQTHTICSCHTWGIVGVLGKFELWSPEQLPALFALGRNSFFSILLVAIALTITFLYLFLKDQWGAVIMQVFSMKEYDSGRIIQMHIVLSTLMAEITFSIITFNIYPSEFACFFISAIFYYTLQTVFFWLFIYTIFLQSRVKEVFDSEKYNSYKIYLFVGYGLPLFVTLTICSLTFNTVKNERVCWLLFEGNSVWGFSGVIATLGVGSLVLLLNIIYSARDMEHGVILQEKCLRTIFTTFFVLLTSVFGARALQERTFFAEYIFSLCNLLQGYSIAIMYCVLRREDPIIKANQVGPISEFDKDDENLKPDEVEEFKDMESDAVDSDEDEFIQVEKDEENMKPVVEGKRYNHVRDGSVIFLQVRGPNDLSDHEEAELDLPIETATSFNGEEDDDVDGVDEGSDEDSDQEIMFRFDELAAMSNTQQQY